MAIDVSALRAANQQRWAVARILTRSSDAFEATAARLCKKENKARFLEAEDKTGVPWFIVAVIKERECGTDPNFIDNIANGQPWSRVTTIVPKGRGPFKSWLAAAVDAISKCPPYAAKNRDWTPGGALTLLEMYNGLGYFNRGLPSPYIWSGTDQYARGKYVADGVFNPNVVDQQLGCAGILLAMADIDQSVADGMRVSNKADDPIPMSSNDSTPQSKIATALNKASKIFTRKA